MVLIAGDGRQGQGCQSVTEHLANEPRGATPGVDVEDAEPGPGGPGHVLIGASENLHTGANSEDDGAVFVGREEYRRSLELSGGERLCGIFSTAQDVCVGRGGYAGCLVYTYQLGLHAAPLGSSGKNQCVD